MSNKTIFKRIALTAVSALAAGTLSVIATPAANAAVSASLATTNAASAVTTLGSETSVGLLASSGSGTTGTATLLSTGTLVVKGVGDTSVFTAMTVTGGTITGATAETTATDHTTNATSTYIYAGTSNKDLSVAFKFASGSSSMTIQIYENAAASTTSGTLRGQWVVTAATSSVAGAYSTLYSRVNTVIVGGSNTTQVNGVDEPDSGTVANGGRGMINFILKDAYGNELADDGAVVISANNGGLVAYNATVGTATAAASITNVSAVTNNNTGAITVKQSVANKPLTTTVTISYNGTVVGTKTLTFEGEVAKVVVDSNLVSAVGSVTDQFRVKYYDSADNRLYPSDDTTMTTVVATTLNAFITAASVGTTGNSSTTAAAKGDLTCAGTAATGANTGSADLQLQYVNASGTIVKSNVWKHTCAGNAVTYKASFDKAIYKPGEIATLTVSAFDAQGKPTHAAADNIAAASDLITCTGCPNSSTAITAPAATDVAGGRDSGNAAGTITYKYVVGTTEGDFTAVVEAEEISEDALGLATKQTVSYSVKAVTTGVTNAEVLAAIVKLIASINKQIRTLQKQLNRR